jgi:hypothetical protein
VDSLAFAGTPRSFFRFSVTFDPSPPLHNPTKLCLTNCLDCGKLDKNT